MPSCLHLSTAFTCRRPQSCGGRGDPGRGGLHHGAVAKNLGAPAVVPAPPALRATAPGWRDPRLWVGIVIVAVSVVAGARLLAAADDTVSVWAVAADVGAGDALTPEDLVATRVRFADSGDLATYFTVDDRLPAELEVTRGVGAGELLPRAAVGSLGATNTLEVPVAVEAEQVPGSVEAGSVVDVYLVASAGAAAGRGRGAGEEPGPALAAVTVVDAPPLAETFGTSGRRQLVLAVEEPEVRRFFRLLGALEGPVVTVVRRG